MKVGELRLMIVGNIHARWSNEDALDDDCWIVLDGREVFSYNKKISALKKGGLESNDKVLEDVYHRYEGHKSITAFRIGSLETHKSWQDAWTKKSQFPDDAWVVLVDSSPFTIHETKQKAVEAHPLSEGAQLIVTGVYEGTGPDEKACYIMQVSSAKKRLKAVYSMLDNN